MHMKQPLAFSWAVLSTSFDIFMFSWITQSKNSSTCINFQSSQSQITQILSNFRVKSLIPLTLSDCCLMPSEQYFSYTVARTSCLLMKWYRLCTRPTHLGFNSASSLKQHSAGIHVVPLGHIILIPGVPVETHRPAASHWQTLSNNVVSNTPCLYERDSNSQL